MIGTLSTLDRTGDTTITWDSDNATEVQVARETFDRMRGKGFMAFKVEGRDRRGQQITTFDPKAERIMLVPQMVGG